MVLEWWKFFMFVMLLFENTATIQLYSFYKIIQTALPVLCGELIENVTQFYVVCVNRPHLTTPVPYFN